MKLEQKMRQSLQLDLLLDRVKPLSAWGKKIKQEWTPFTPMQKEEWEQDLQQQMLLQKHLTSFTSSEKQQMERTLSQIPDITHLISWVSNKECETSPIEALSLTDWFRMKQFLYFTWMWNEQLNQRASGASFSLQLEEKESLFYLLKKLNPAEYLTPHFSLVDGISLSYEQLHRRERRLVQKIETAMRRLGERKDIHYSWKRNRFGEWVIPRSHPIAEQFVNDESVLKERETVFELIFTLKPTEEVVTWKHEQEVLLDQMKQWEQRIFAQLTEEFQPFCSVLKQIGERVATYDFLWAKQIAAQSWNGCRPEWRKEEVSIQGGRNPLLEEHLHSTGKGFTPIDIKMTAEATVLIGPNMGGKTIAMKTIGVILVLAHYGLFVPAEACVTPLFSWMDAVWDDEQDASRGLSTFGAEMIHLRELLERDEPGFILLDELAKGTNPQEGAALAQAMTHYLCESRHWSIQATHYVEVLRVKKARLYQMAGIRADINIEQFPIDQLHKAMDYRIVPYDGSRPVMLQGIRIAEVLGIPRSIINRAEELLEEVYDGKTLP